MSTPLKKSTTPSSYTIIDASHRSAIAWPIFDLNATIETVEGQLLQFLLLAGSGVPECIPDSLKCCDQLLQIADIGDVTSQGVRHGVEVQRRGRSPMDENLNIAGMLVYALAHATDVTTSATSDHGVVAKLQDGTECCVQLRLTPGPLKKSFQISSRRSAYKHTRGSEYVSLHRANR